MSEEAKSGIALSRALYFSDLSCSGSPVAEEEEAESGRVKRPSYVGISTSLNGYTPYAPYRTPGEAARKISPPLHLPNLLPQHLDSVSLVLNQDGYHRSIEEFHKTMRDLNMGRPENGDMTDNGRMMANDDFYPTSHIKQVIENGEGKSVTTITSFHTPGKQNLVSKQIERLYGNDPMAQVRLTSPEPAGSPTYRRSPVTSSGGGGVRSPVNTSSGGSPALSDGGSPASNGTTPERKYSGGFFSKRFGIKPMKDHSTLKSPETPKEFKPLKVPAVFKLLRPEFREQLKQSSCKVSMPDEGVKERIIPIRMETSPTKSQGTPSTPSTPSSTTPTTQRSPASTRATPSSRPSPNSNTERVIPITRLSNGQANGIKPLNGHTPNGVTSPTNGLPRRSAAPTVIGFRNAPTSPSTPAPAAANEKAAAAAAVPEKNVVIRKLSPLSPKHMVVPSSSPKPAPAPKPEHLMSPPMSPAPSSTPSPENPPAPAPASPTEETASSLPEIQKLNIKEADKIEQSREVLVPGRNGEVPEGRAERQEEVRRDPPSRNVEVPDRSMAAEEVEDATPEEMELVSEKDLVRDDYQYHDHQDDEYNDEKEQYNNYYQCGLRERELLCPILEEDNESTASGSVINLQTGVYSPDDPLLLTEQGEVQDGHYFIKVLENEIFKFEEQICDFEEELAMSNDIPEEHRESILLTVGFAKLLMAQKLMQFRGLCDKNISVTKEEDPFVPTSHDLAGFWDMVHIQVEQVHNRFAALGKLRSEGWKVKTEEKKTNNKAKKNAANKLVNKPIKPKEKSEAAKARDEARKKMLEDRKKAMRANQNQQAESDLIIIM